MLKRIDVDIFKEYDFSIINYHIKDKNNKAILSFIISIIFLSKFLILA